MWNNAPFEQAHEQCKMETGPNNSTTVLMPLNMLKENYIANNGQAR